jgi:hypothetical protein
LTMTLTSFNELEFAQSAVVHSLIWFKLKCSYVA